MRLTQLQPVHRAWTGVTVVPLVSRQDETWDAHCSAPSVKKEMSSRSLCQCTCVFKDPKSSSPINKYVLPLLHISYE